MFLHSEQILFQVLLIAVRIRTPIEHIWQKLIVVTHVNTHTLSLSRAHTQTHTLGLVGFPSHEIELVSLENLKKYSRVS